MSEANVEEARRILLEAGAIAEQIDIREWKAGEYLVSAVGFGCGVTDRREQFADTPQEVATNLVAAKAEAAYGGGHDDDRRSHDGTEDSPVPLYIPEGDEQPSDEAIYGMASADEVSGLSVADAGESSGQTLSPEESPDDDSFDLGSIEDYTLDPPALEGAEPTDADFSEDDSPTYVFGDNLGNDRLVRIGQITEYADALIADVWTAANAQPDEHSTARAHVVTHLNASGAYVGPSPEIFSRFVELETANAKVSAINTAKADKIAFIRVANHAQVEAFDVEANWP